VRTLPERDVVRVLHHLEHVITLVEAELLQGELQRHGARAAEAGADDGECHGALLLCVLERARRWVPGAHGSRWSAVKE
jgi:hypothetical protein